ncbi:hypothetical protein ElyMa_001698300 [Elysia marginata]|uniref:Uncharacterized protein n=1 Tax=Elysia marginata TaxID=1093978 RepID=A0AAV4JVU2_9GAST|nr:hypothetical protein ElyMa_001698300 [Elysia marginata]
MPQATLEDLSRDVANISRGWGMGEEVYENRSPKSLIWRTSPGDVADISRSDIFDLLPNILRGRVPGTRGNNIVRRLNCV